MKDFWSENSKIVGKILLNQFGSTFLGIMVITAASSAKSQKDWLMLFASIFSSIFYLFLIYNVIWEKGGQDRIKIDGGRAAKNKWKGLYISLCANIPNFILAILVLISDPFKSAHAWAGTLNVVGRAACLLWEGMYAGLVSYFSPHNPIIHLLYIFPAMFVTTFGYMLGVNNARVLSIFELKPPKSK